MRLEPFNSIPPQLAADGPGARPFFLPASPGQRFCLFHPPVAGRPARGAILYVHPFAEELNQSRRMAALQARAFAAAGYGVLQIDLYGCGDSDGDFADARWHIWQHDLVLACAWLTRHADGPLTLWGLRLGALLALDAAAALAPSRLILWQPVLDGKAHIDQFLRLLLASQMVSADSEAAPARQRLAAGASVEVAGYTLAAELAAAIDALDALDNMALAPACPVHWFELTAASAALAPRAARVAERWRGAGVALDLRQVPGQPFWNGIEIVECQALLAATETACA